MLFIAYTVCDHAQYQSLDQKMFPLDPADLIYQREMLFYVQPGQMTDMATVFIPEEKSKREWLLSQDYSGYLVQGETFIPAVFRLIPETKYQRKIKNLMKMRTINGMETDLINDEYLRMFYKLIVYYENTMELENIEFDNFICSFGESADLIRYHYFPVWNIQNCVKQVNRFPVLQVDLAYYKYEILLENPDRWMVVLPDQFEGYVLHNDCGIEVYTKNYDCEKMSLLYFHEFDQLTSEYPVLSNQLKDLVFHSVDKQYRSYLTEFKLVQTVTGYENSQLVRLLEYTLEKENYVRNTNTGVVYETDLAKQKEKERTVLTCHLKFERGNCEQYIAEAVVDFILHVLAVRYPQYDFSANFMKTKGMELD